MKKFSLSYLRYCLSALSALMLFSQSVISAQELRDTAIANFNILEELAQEKVYLHRDKPY